MYEIIGNIEEGIHYTRFIEEQESEQEEAKPGERTSKSTDTGSEGEEQPAA